MPSDNEESQAIWNAASSQQRGNRPYKGGDQDVHTNPYMSSYSDEEADFPISGEVPESGEVEQEEPETDPWQNVREEDDASFSRTEMLRRLTRQISAAIVPLLFGAITFLFVLPLVLTQRAMLTSPGLLPLAVLLVVVAVVQGIPMYFAGANDGLWSLCIVVGFEVFLLIGCFAIFGPVTSLILVVVLLILDAILARRTVVSTPPGTVDVVYNFGKYVRTLVPGLNVILPWEKVVSRLSVLEIPWASPLQRVQIARDQEVQFVASIAYQLVPEDAHLIVASARNWEEDLHERFLATIQAVMNTLTPEDFIAWQQGGRGNMRGHDVAETTRWDRVNAVLKQRLQEDVAEWGVQINWVGIRDVSLTPRISFAEGTAAAKGGSSVANRPHSAAADPIVGGQTHIKQAPPVATTTAKPPQAQAAPAASTSGPSIVDDMTEIYEAVRQGKITDPETIRSIARRFEALASDPEASKNFGYDAARAAQNLYARAQYIEQTNEPVSYDAETSPDWQIPRQRPMNNNLMTGG